MIHFQVKKKNMEFNLKINGILVVIISESYKKIFFFLHIKTYAWFNVALNSKISEES